MPINRQLAEEVYAFVAEQAAIDDEPEVVVGQHVWDQDTWSTVLFDLDADADDWRKAFAPAQDVPMMYVLDPQASVCGTGACFAGEVAIKTGARLAMLDYEYESLMVELAHRFTRGTTIATVVAPDGEVMSVSQYAREQLGLEQWQASMLFAADNRAEDIRECLDIFYQFEDGTRALTADDWYRFNSSYQMPGGMETAILRWHTERVHLGTTHST